MTRLSARVPAALVLCLAFSALGLLTLVSAADAPEWPRFRGPLANPVSAERLPDTWSKTENVEWTTAIPGRGWSSPIVSGNRVFVTAATTDGPSKSPQAGTQYSNEYIAELQKQGLSASETEARVVARDFELPGEVTLHYFLYCVDLETGKLRWKQEYYAGRPPVGRHRKNSFTSETPVTDGTLVYVYSTSLGLWAYDMECRLVGRRRRSARLARTALCAAGRGARAAPGAPGTRAPGHPRADRARLDGPGGIHGGGRHDGALDSDVRRGHPPCRSREARAAARPIRPAAGSISTELLDAGRAGRTRHPA